MRVAVTGASGFLGRHVMAALPKAGHTAIAYHVTHRGPWFDSFDAAIHCAAACGGVGYHGADGYRILADNLELNQAVINACVEADAKLVAVSSVCAYPENAPVPLREEYLWTGRPEESVAPYGVAKLTLHEQCRLAAKHYGLSCTVLVPTNLYGPGDEYVKRNHLVSSLIRRLSGDGDKVTLWGDGSVTRDLLYVEDCAEACVRALDGGCDNGLPINVGTGQEISIAGLAGMVARAVGFDGDVEWDTDRPNGRPRCCMDIDRARMLLDWTPRTSLEDGLAATVADYRARVLSCGL